MTSIGRDAAARNRASSFIEQIRKRGNREIVRELQTRETREALPVEVVQRIEALERGLFAAQEANASLLYQLDDLRRNYASQAWVAEHFSTRGHGHDGIKIKEAS
jgi:hypothetical protein